MLKKAAGSAVELPDFEVVAAGVLRRHGYQLQLASQFVVLEELRLLLEWEREQQGGSDTSAGTPCSLGTNGCSGDAH